MRPTTNERLRIYAMEAVLLGAFLVSACSFGILLEHPDSVVHRALPVALCRRFLMGLAMGGTAVGLIYSYFGKRTGAHMNPAVTLSAWRLGRIGGWDVVGYIAGQFLGAVGGVTLVLLVARMWVAHPSINYVATVPHASVGIAWCAEAVIAAGMMGMTMALNRLPRVAPYTGVVAGVLVCMYITFEAPVSGMSMNPARTFGSAVWAGTWESLWIYFTAPVVGILGVVEVGRLVTRRPGELCCKQNHDARVESHCPCDCLIRRSGANVAPATIPEMSGEMS